jgi:hypothetical protein
MDGGGTVIDSVARGVDPGKGLLKEEGFVELRRRSSAQSLIRSSKDRKQLVVNYYGYGTKLMTSGILYSRLPAGVG